METEFKGLLYWFKCKWKETYSILLSSFQISPLSVFSHFRFFLHVLFSMNSLITVTNWGLKVWFHSFYICNTFQSMCLQLYKPSYDFNLSDPYCRLLETGYKSLHDPHLKSYYRRKDILRRLKKGGYITSNNKVGWSLLPVNQHKPMVLKEACFCTSLGTCVNF